MLTLESFGSAEIFNDETQEYLTIHFSAGDDARQERWRNYGLSAEFLGDYFANFFPGETLPGRRLTKRDVIKGTVTFVANELIENAIKFNLKETTKPIEISLQLHPSQLVFKVTNYVNPQSAERFRQFLEPIHQADDLEALMLAQMEDVALTGRDSRMGILTMMCDYGITFGWRFRTIEPEIIEVNVAARLDIE